MEVDFSESVRQYIGFLQDSITRMAKNSSNCKAWLIGLVTGGLVFSEDAQLHNVWILLFPTILFFILDCYYLGLERRFRKIERLFLDTLLANEDVSNIIYSFNIRPLGSNFRWTCQAMKSLTTTPFYAVIAFVIIIIGIIYRF
jgi:hypothetical protein